LACPLAIRCLDNLSPVDIDMLTPLLEAFSTVARAADVSDGCSWSTWRKVAARAVDVEGSPSTSQERLRGSQSRGGKRSYAKLCKTLKSDAFPFMPTCLALVSFF
jgi:hypothetical protein